MRAPPILGEINFFFNDGDTEFLLNSTPPPFNLGSDPGHQLVGGPDGTLIRHNHI